MNVELVRATMPDGLKLDGALHRPKESSFGHDKLSAVDVVIGVHGTGANFYSLSLWPDLTRHMLDWGVPVLMINTRGHDGINWTHWDPQARLEGESFPRLLGSSFEVVDQCRLDMRGWIKFLTDQGYERIGLMGHSLGAVKCLYSQAHEPHPAVRCIAALSSPRLSHSHFLTTVRGREFGKEFARAEELVRDGKDQQLMEVRFPLPFVISASGYLDKYGKEERYNVLKIAPHVACPQLYTYGSVELMFGMAFGGMPEALGEIAPQCADLKVAIVGGGDHSYTGVQGDLAAAVERWLRKLGGQ